MSETTEYPPAKTTTSSSRLMVAFLLLASTAGSLCLWQFSTNYTKPSTMTAVRRRLQTEVTAFGENPSKILGLCEGDCDTDSDCEEGLICFQRRSTEDIPGCQITGDKSYSSMDVCIPDPTVTESPTFGPTPSPEPTEAPTKDNQPTNSPTPIGTNSWVQTYGVTTPFEFVGPQSAIPPTSEEFAWLYTDEYTQPKQLEYVGNDGTPEKNFPLGPCEADCDMDDDCAGPLVCLQRFEGDPVPGCLGEDPSGADYCVWPEGYENGMPAAHNWNDGFNLKLYWEEGYDWQNETIERKWCITRDYEGTWNTGMCWFGLDQIDCDPNEMFVDKCDHDDPRQRFEFLPVSSDEVQIRAYGEDRCFHRDNRKVLLQSCDPNLHNQRWFATRGGFNGDRFELSQKTFSQACLNQDHHPKPGEVIRMQSCEFARSPKSLTSWWVVY